MTMEGSDLALDVWGLQTIERILGRPGFEYLWWPGRPSQALGN
jgi:hypothetical protein